MNKSMNSLQKKENIPVDWTSDDSSKSSDDSNVVYRLQK